MVNLAPPGQTLTLSVNDSITLTPPVGNPPPANATVEYRVWRTSLKPIQAQWWYDAYATIPGILRSGSASASGYRVSQAPYTASFKPLDLNDGLGPGLYFTYVYYDIPGGGLTGTDPNGAKTIYVEAQGKTRPATGSFSYTNLPTASVQYVKEGSNLRVTATTNSTDVYGVEFYAILAPGTSIQRFVHLGMDPTAPYEATWDPSLPLYHTVQYSNDVLVAAMVIDSRGMHNCDVMVSERP